MKAGTTLFRIRMPIMAAIVCIGFFAPWVRIWEIGSRISLLEWLALYLSRLGLLRFTLATPTVIVCGSLIAAVGALLRIWGAAWLGPAVVVNREMRAGSLTADGPYRFVRNPLYLGLWCMTTALALLMPVSGACFVLIAVPVFLLPLVKGEEDYLSARMGENYRAYRDAVPRLFPRLRTNLKPTGRKPHWLQAVLAEINPIGVFVTLACLSWTYDERFMDRAILITFGLSLVVRAFLPALSREASPR